MAIIFYFYYLLVDTLRLRTCVTLGGTGTGRQPFPRMTVPCSRSPRTQYTRPVCACDCTRSCMAYARNYERDECYFWYGGGGKRPREKTPRNHSKIRNVAFAKGLNIFTDFNDSVLIVRNRSSGRRTANPRRLVFFGKIRFFDQILIFSICPPLTETRQSATRAGGNYIYWCTADTAKSKTLRRFEK